MANTDPFKWTNLYRPRITVDLVVRPRVFDLLDRSRDKRLIWCPPQPVMARASCYLIGWMGRTPEYQFVADPSNAEILAELDAALTEFFNAHATPEYEVWNGGLMVASDVPQIDESP